MKHLGLLLVTLTIGATPARAADQWIEVKSAHFAVTSNAGEGPTKTLAWQLEQIRSAIGVLWPWAQVDLNRPLTVFVLKDETSMRSLAPRYWEEKGAVHPATLWVGGRDQNFLALRTDVEGRDTSDSNPYITSYFSYVSLILQQSVGRSLPLWFSRGLAGVMSNTIVRESKILLGPPIRWHLERIHNGVRMKLPALVKVTRSSPEYRNGEDLLTFDAEAWAFVHFLMFGENGERWPKLDQFAKSVARGADPDAAFREALGSPEQLDAPFVNYVNRSLYSYRQVNVDASVKREGFTVAKLAPADAASRRALFHAAMQRPVEARAAIAEARKAGEAPDALAAEGILLEQEEKPDEAQAAYARAAEAGTTDAYVYYRLASLLWRGNADHDTLLRVEKLLSRAIGLNTRFAAAYALIGEARAALGNDQAIGMVLRAIALEPAEPAFHISAANVLWRANQIDAAIKHAQAAQALADTDEERRRAADMLDRLARAKG
jgi:tetratricopeptide (TPR) repeat protein